MLGNRLDTLRCSVPAVAYTLQSNLVFVALANLDAPTFQVTYQTRTLFTALFSRLCLGRRLGLLPWLARPARAQKRLGADLGYSLGQELTGLTSQGRPPHSLLSPGVGLLAPCGLARCRGCTVWCSPCLPC